MHPCLETPSIRGYSPQDRIDLEKIFDLSMDLRTDEAVQRTLESEQRRRQKIWFMPHAGGGMFRPHIFRALFQKDIGGVAGVSDSWFDADLVDSSAGKVVSFKNYIDQTQLFTQAVAGNRVNDPVADASFNNAKTCTFTATTEYYISSLAASFFTFEHAGTGAENFVTFLPAVAGAGVLLGNASGANPTAQIDVTGGKASYVVRNAFPVPLVINTVGTSTITGLATYINTSYSLTQIPQWSLRVKTAQEASGAVAVAPVATDPAVPMSLGSLGTGGVLFNGRFRAAYMLRRYFTSGERTIAQQFIRSQTGIA